MHRNTWLFPINLPQKNQVCIIWKCVFYMKKYFFYMNFHCAFKIICIYFLLATCVSPYTHGQNEKNLAQENKIFLATNQWVEYQRSHKLIFICIKHNLGLLLRLCEFRAEFILPSCHSYITSDRFSKNTTQFYLCILWFKLHHDYIAWRWGMQLTTTVCQTAWSFKAPFNIKIIRRLSPLSLLGTINDCPTVEGSY